MLLARNIAIDRSRPATLTVRALRPWEFDPEKRLITFDADENRLDTTRFILPGLKDRYAVYVGVRKKACRRSGSYSGAMVMGTAGAPPQFIRLSRRRRPLCAASPADFLAA